MICWIRRYSYRNVLTGFGDLHIYVHMYGVISIDLFAIKKSDLHKWHVYARPSQDEGKTVGIFNWIWCVPLENHFSRRQ